MPARSPKEQLGVDLPDPQEPESVQPEQQPEEPERPDFLLDKFKTAEDQARGYAEAERRMQEAVESQRRLEAQVASLTEAVEGLQPAPQQQPPAGNEEALRASLTDALERDPVGTIAYLAQQYAQAEIQQHYQQQQQYQDPQLRAQQERDNQMLAMFVDQRLKETLDDWDDYRDRVGEAIIADQSLIPEVVLTNPEATVQSITRVYENLKARDIIEQSQNGNFVTTQMKRQAQTMSGGGVRNADVDPSDEKMDALKNAIQGASYAAWRGA